MVAFFKFLKNIFNDNLILIPKKYKKLLNTAAFWAYGGLTAIAFLLFYRNVPETKGLQIEHIQHLFHRRADDRQANTSTAQSEDDAQHTGVSTVDRF